MSNISILPTLLTHRSDQLGKSQLVIRIYHQRRIASVINTGQKCSKKFWDNKMREVKRGEQNYSLINSLIKNKVSDLQKKFMEAELRGQPLTKEKIKTIVTGKDYNKDFIAYCRDRIPDRYPSPSQKETRRSYFGELTKLESFQKSISFGDLSPHFFSKYKAWLIKDRYNSDNTVWKALKFINTMINDAIPAGFITDNPFKQFHRGTYKQGRPVYLTMPECEAFEKVTEVMQGKMETAGWYFLFMCYSGLRFQDAVKNFSAIEHVINNERIVFITQKSKTTVNIKIHTRLANALAHMQPIKVSNKDFNAMIRAIAAVAGINKKITAHTGRHTFGAISAELNIPIKKTQQLMGHRKSASTEIYYHITEKGLDKEMLKWDELRNN